MAGSRVFIRQLGSALTPVDTEQFGNEGLLQQALADHPDQKTCVQEYPSDLKRIAAVAYTPDSTRFAESGQGPSTRSRSPQTPSVSRKPVPTAESESGPSDDPSVASTQRRQA